MRGGIQYPDLTILSLFQEQAKKNSSKVAVLYKKQALTYEELDRESSHLAKILIENGAGRSDLIGICLERSIDMIVGILGF